MTISCQPQLLQGTAHWHQPACHPASHQPLYRRSPIVYRRCQHILPSASAVGRGASDGPWDEQDSSGTARLTRDTSARAVPTFELRMRSLHDSVERAPLLTRHRDSFDVDMDATPSLPPASRTQGAPQPGGAGPSSQQQQPQQGGLTGTLGLPPTPRGFGSWQYLVSLCAVSVVICYADRSNISTAMLPMADHFNWDKGFQGLVFSSFFSGYALTQVLGGQLADKLGGKVVLAAGVTLWSFFTFLTPQAAAAGAVPLIAARVLLGVGEGVAFPAIHSLIARNVPQDSRSTAVGLVTAASYAGTALAFGISPLIISRLGWEWVFVLFSGLALLWLPLWLPAATTDTDSWKWLRRKGVASSTSSAAAVMGQQHAQGMGVGHPTETDALLGGVQGQGAGMALNPPSAQQGGRQERGFWALLRRKEVWAICAAQYCQSWGMYGLLTWLPTFFKEYYQIEIADLAAYTLLPYVVQGGMGLLAGIIADQLLVRGWGVRSVRVMMQVAGMLGPAACLMLAVSPLVGPQQPALASNLITVGLGFSALSLGGVSASHLDVAPRHAGVIFGAGNTAATAAGLLSVPFTGFLLKATNSWPLVFGVTAAHYVVGAALWTLWVGDRQLAEDREEGDPLQGDSPPLLKGVV